MRLRSLKKIELKSHVSLLRILPFILLIAIAACSGAPEKVKISFVDASGEEYSDASNDLDVPYVPTPMEVVRSLLNLAAVGPRDFLIDLGSGDGRIVITAAKEYGARGFGVDLNKDLVALSKQYAAAEGLGKKVDFFVRDIFKTDIRRASVLTLYLLNDVNLKLRPKLFAELKPGSRIVSHDFHMGEWRPDMAVYLDEGSPIEEDTSLYLWIMPAKVAGRWQWRMTLLNEPHTFELDLHQNFQHISGSVKDKDYSWRIFDAALQGDRIKFSMYSEANQRMIRQDYTGRIEADRIYGTVETLQLDRGIEKVLVQWQAVRRGLRPE